MDKLQEIVNNPDSHLKDIIQKKAINICGIKLYWINTNHKLKIIMKNLNEQALFFTASIANI